MNILDNLKKNNYFFFFFFIVLLYIYGKGQLTHTFASLDDWEFATNIPIGMEHHGTPFDKTLWEGRWVNFLWSKIAIHFTLRELYICFILGYSLFCWIASSFISTNKYYQVVISFIFFLCPIYADLSLWPITLTPSVWLGSFVLICHKFQKNIFIPFLLLILTFLSYPPVTAICFIFLCISCKNYKQIIYYTILYMITYILSVIIIYALNGYFHSFLGVKIADWRHPHPIKNLYDLFYNCRKAIHGLIREYFYTFKYIPLLLLSIFTSILCKKEKRFLLQFLFIAYILATIDFLLLVLSGTDAIQRSIIWPWFIIISIFFYNFDFLKNKLFIIIFTISSFIFIGYANSIWNQHYLSGVQKTKLTEYYGMMLLSTNTNKFFFVAIFLKLYLIIIFPITKRKCLLSYKYGKNIIYN